MLRFAPSPTGDMHIGNLRVAIFNYILSIQKKEKLIIRIEDTDSKRNIDGKDKEIINILDKFAIKYFKIVYQSHNLKYHRQMALKLLNDDKAFNCFCSQRKLDYKKEEAKKLKKAFRYDGSCKKLKDIEVLDKEESSTIRLKKPENNISFKDIIRGELSFNPYDIDDFLIMKNDKTPSYNFACSIDDMLMDISTVLRGEDHLSNTPKQIAIRNALSYEKKIEYIHLPIILDKDGKKMSKRNEISSVKWLLNEGYLPEAIINYLILLGNKTPKEIFTLKEASTWFDINKVSKTAAKFDLDKLNFINKSHLKNLEENKLAKMLNLKEDLGSLAKIYLEESSTLKDLKNKINLIFSKKMHKDYQNNLNLLKDIINKEFKTKIEEDFSKFKKILMDKSGLKAKEFFKALRFLLTGCEKGPELSKIYPKLAKHIKEVIQ